MPKLLCSKAGAVMVSVFKYYILSQDELESKQDWNDLSGP